MKKTLALLMALVMALALCGCAENLPQIEIPPIPKITDTPQPQPQTGEDEGTSETTDQIPEAPLPTAEETPVTGEEAHIRILVTNGRTEMNDYDPAEGEELILNFAYDMPRVYVENEPEVSARINETLATVEETFYTGDSYSEEGRFIGYSAMLEAAEDNFSYVRENNTVGMPLEYSDTLTALVTRADNAALSVIYTENCYMGGAHGSYGSNAVNFDMSTGEQLTLDKLSEDEGFGDFLVERMLSIVEQDKSYSDRIAEDFLPEGGMEEAFRNLLRDGSWYFDGEGLVIFSELEELGPYAAGIVEFRIPYADLEGKLDARWLFPGQRQGKGKPEVTELSELEGGETEIVDSLILNEDGQELCIVADGIIYDVSLTSVYYVDRFYDSAQLWYASCLDDCALQIRVVVPEGLPNLRIAYTTADGVRHGKLLSQSGLDGSYMLVDDDIQAVG